jgi:hypothetical protein
VKRKKHLLVLNDRRKKRILPRFFHMPVRLLVERITDFLRAA